MKKAADMAHSYFEEVYWIYESIGLRLKSAYDDYDDLQVYAETIYRLMEEEGKDPTCANASAGNDEYEQEY